MIKFHEYHILSILLLFLMIGCSDGTIIMEEEEIKHNLINTNIGEAKNKTKSKEERRESINKAYNYFITLEGSNPNRIKTIEEISGVYYSLKDYDTSMKMDRRMLEIAISEKDSIAMAKAYGYLGIYYRRKDKLDSAFKSFNDADKIYRNFDNSNKKDPLTYSYDHGKVLIDLAKLSRKVKDYSESEDLTIKAIEKFDLSGDNSYMPLSYSNLGIVAKELERYEDAVFYHSKAIEYTKNTPKDTLYAVLGNNNIGTVYKSAKKYEKAMEYYTKALSYYKFLKNRPKRLSLLLDNLGYVKFLQDSHDEEAFSLFQKAFKIRDSVNDVVGLSTNNLHFAEYYKAQGNDSLAKSYAIKVKEATRIVNNNVELLQAYQLLSKVTDSDEGLGYAQKYIKLNDSLIKEERSYVNKFARIKFETEEKTQEIAAISRENQLLIFAILGLSILFLLGYVIFRQQQSNKELLFEQKQQQSNQEIYRLLLSQQLKLEEGRKMEQHRMSEELHDGVLGRLFGVRLSLDGINQRANDGFTESRNVFIDELKSIEKEIRLISHDLGTDTLSPDVAYVDVVESLVSDLCTVHKMDFEFANDENIDWETIDDQKKVNLFRIIQESLQNIFKHAKAESVKISFDYVDDKINLTILDDGIGFKSSKVKRGIGLKNITSRVTQMNGVVDFISNQDSGTKVSVGIPI
ncbi:sensor histidine kinase [uncultured Aquimarina sp.]|uniref:tetratricopeptide repeat-containing sensor histidine kinase n=1 Tax=uncultured Aquimarina sp. TaxID=575652 RepID=UPI0026086CF9|nr:sensor histidine kinase [uncultured Aquimarina sp.]